MLTIWIFSTRKLIWSRPKAFCTVPCWTFLTSGTRKKRSWLRQGKISSKTSPPPPAIRTTKNDTSHYLTELENQLAVYQLYQERLERYSRLQDSPYFGRVDFAEGRLSGGEFLYWPAGPAGSQNLSDSNLRLAHTFGSLFYQGLPGCASYSSPSGEISGRLL